MNWINGFEATYYMTIVDQDTWKDIERIEIINASVSVSDSDLIESASVECTTYDKGEQWIRLWLDARQDGSQPEHVPMFTGIATSPAESINGKLRKNKLECYSVLKPASEVPLPRGWYAQKGRNGALIIKELLSITPAPIYVDDSDSYILSQNIIAENNENHLSMTNKILKAIDGRIKIEGNGIIHISPKPNSIIMSFDPLENDGIQTTFDITNDLYKCPNVFQAFIGDASAIARDENINSPISIQNRRREVWKTEDNCNLNDGETLLQYAHRRLKEEQTIAMQVSYNRRFVPEISVGDYIRLHYPEQGIDGMFVIKSQSFNLEYGSQVSETSEKISDIIKYLNKIENANWKDEREYDTLVDELGNELIDEFTNTLSE